MVRLMRLGVVLLSILALTIGRACEGDQGPQGPPGNQGDPGEPGQDLTIAPPEDVYFSIAVLNQFDGEEFNYRSQDFIRITFDTTETPGSALVVGVYLPHAPDLDGEDGDIDEWSTTDELFESDIPLSGVIGTDNGISTISVRCAYDESFIYFFLTWAEVAGNMQIGANRNLQEWQTAEPNNFTGDIIGSEDRVWMMFIEDPSYIPSTSDCLLECGLDNASFSDSLHIDVWDWRASVTDLVGFADDCYLKYKTGVSVVINGDVGGPAFMRNINAEGTLPAWMAYNDPSANANYPFFFRSAIPFRNGNFLAFSTIPGYMALIPYGDRGNIYSASAFQSPRWTVEIKRARNTGSGTDIQF